MAARMVIPVFDGPSMDAIKRVVRAELNRILGDNADGPEAPPDGSPEVYLAELPDDDTGIPGATYEDPEAPVAGKAKCKIWKLIPKDGNATDVESDYKFKKVLKAQADDEEEPEQKDMYVFNTYHMPALKHCQRFIHIHREKYGRWMCEKPENSFFAILNADLEQGDENTAEAEVIKWDADVSKWRRTGMLFDVADYFMNEGDTLETDVKLEITNTGGRWVWRVAICTPSDTLPEDASEEE